MASAVPVWNPVAAPRLDLSGFTGVSNSFNAGMEAFNNILKRRETIDSANYDQGKVNNTNEFLNAVQEPSSVEDFQAKKAALVAMLASKGAQIDGTAARSALDGRLSTLQQRTKAAGEYGDWSTDRAELPQINAIKAAISMGDTAGARNLLDAGTYRDETTLEDLLRVRTRGITTESQQDATHASNLETAVSTRAHQAEQDRIARAKLVLEGASLTEQRKAREAATNNAGLVAKTSHLKALGDLTEAQSKASQEVIKNTAYAERLNEGNMDSVIKHMTSTFGSPNYGIALTEKLNALRKEMPSVPVAIIKDAIDIQKNSLSSMLWGNDGNATNVVNIIKEQMKDPRLTRQIAFADEQTAKALGQYKGSTLDLPKPEPVAGAAPLPPQLKFTPPTSAKDGALSYATPGSFNISTNDGIAAPTNMPKGALDVSIGDGDTIAVKGANGSTMKFRFNAIDAQETAKTKDGKTIPGQALSEQARSFVTNAFKQGRVDVRIASNKPDSHGRHVADIYVDGKNLNEALVRNGLATVMSVARGIGPSEKAHYDKLQAEAMKESLGIYGNLNNGETPTGSAYRMFGNNLY